MICNIPAEKSAGIFFVSGALSFCIRKQDPSIHSLRLIAEGCYQGVYRSTFRVHDVSTFSDPVCRLFVVEHRTIWNEAVIVNARTTHLKNREYRYIIYAYAYIIYL